MIDVRGRVASARVKTLIVLGALCAMLLAGCASPPARASVGAGVGAQPTGTPVAAPTRAPPPTATALIQQIAATALPTVAPTPDRQAPPRVGLQVGHWKIEEHPDEMAQLRKFSGVYYRGYDEWELNIVIAQAVLARLAAAGVTVDLLPANVPMGYTADAFLSIHVDGITGATAATRRGWKVTMPFRASTASQGLAAAVGSAYAATTGLPFDGEQASNNLRAYYAFASYRYWHSIAPTTPAAIIECGFMTHPADRKLIFEQPELLAEGIARGILAYLAESYPLSAAARAPVGPGMLRANAAGATLYTRAATTSAAVVRVAAGQRLVPVDMVAGWYLVFTHGGAWDLGWVRGAEVVETGEGLVPPQPRPQE